MMNKPTCFGKQFGNEACFHTCMHSDQCYATDLVVPPVQPIQLIGIAGKARSGKDTSASYLMRHLGWPVVPFAGPLKEMLRVGFGLTQDQLYGDQKEVVDPRYGKTPRYMMQTLGTEWGRDRLGSGVWGKALLSSLTGPTIIPDVRFEEEADLIRGYGTLLHIVGRGGIEGDHASEVGVGVDTRDIVISNHGSLARLYQQLDAWVLTR